MQVPQQLVLPWNTSEHKEKMRKKRNASLERYRRHAIVLGIMTLVAIVLGIISIFSAKLGADKAMYVGGPLGPGVFGLVCCILTYLLHRAGRAEESSDDTSFSLKCLFVLHFILHILLALSCIGVLLPIIYVVETSQSEEWVLAICILGIVTCLAMMFWSPVAIVYYFYYLRVYGFKDDQQTDLENQIYLQNRQFQQRAHDHANPLYTI